MKLSYNLQDTIGVQDSVAAKSEKRSPDDVDSERVCEKYRSCRWSLAYLCFACRFLQFTFRQCLSMAVVCITPTPGNVVVYANVTGFAPSSTAPPASSQRELFDWDAQTQGMVLSAYFYGFIATPILGGYIAGRFGYKTVIGVTMLISTGSTLLMPLGVRAHPHVVVVLRVITGAVTGITVPALQGIWGVWAPKEEKTRLATLTYAGTDIGNVVAFVVSGFLCEVPFGGGWPLIFYVFGSSTVVWLVLWIYSAFDSPNLHPRITEKEKKFIVSNTFSRRSGKPMSPPWLKILTSPPFWAILIAHVSNSWGMVVLQVMLPDYMRDVLRFDIKQNGVLSTLPFIGRFVGHMVFCYLADLLLAKKILSTGATRKSFQCLGFIIPATMITGVGFLDHQQRGIAVMLLTLSMTINASSDVAFRVNLLDIAPRFAALLGGMTLTCSQSSGIAVPMLTAFLTPDGTQEQWRIVFLICAGVFLFGAVVFVAFGHGEEQEWAKERRDGTGQTVVVVGQGRVSRAAGGDRGGGGEDAEGNSGSRF